MKAVIFLSIASLSVKGDRPFDNYNWVFDAVKSCEFFSEDSPNITRPCEQYYRKFGHDTDNGEAVLEWGIMWKDRHSREVHYVPRTGMLGVSTFTIGDVYDSGYNGGERMENAVSYSKNRETIVIGVPNEGYIFYVYPAK